MATKTTPSPPSREGHLAREATAARSGMASQSSSAASLTLQSGARHCAVCTFPLATRRGSASSCVLGQRPWKTEKPGFGGRLQPWQISRFSWPPFLHYRQFFMQENASGHRLSLQYFALQVPPWARRATIVVRQRPAHPLLGQLLQGLAA
jgi:hypothetical protein